MAKILRNTWSNITEHKSKQNPVYLLCFKLTLASPVERDITAPRANREEKGVDLEGGATGSRDSALRIAMRTSATA